jgi:hypothetical protein
MGFCSRHNAAEIDTAVLAWKPAAAGLGCTAATLRFHLILNHHINLLTRLTTTSAAEVATYRTHKAALFGVVVFLSWILLTSLARRRSSTAARSSGSTRTATRADAATRTATRSDTGALTATGADTAARTAAGADTAARTAARSNTSARTATGPYSRARTSTGWPATSGSALTDTGPDSTSRIILGSPADRRRQRIKTPSRPNPIPDGALNLPFTIYPLPDKNIFEIEFARLLFGVFSNTLGHPESDLRRHCPDDSHRIRTQHFYPLRIETKCLNGFASFPKRLDIALAGDHVGVGRAKNGVVGEHAAECGKIASFESFGEALVQALNSRAGFIFGHERPFCSYAGNNGMRIELARYSISAGRSVHLVSTLNACNRPCHNCGNR